MRLAKLGSAFTKLSEAARLYNTSVWYQAVRAKRCAGAIETSSTPDRLHALVANGRAFVERERNWVASAQRYRQIYDHALARSDERAAQLRAG